MKTAAQFDKTIRNYLEDKNKDLLSLENHKGEFGIEKCQSPIEELLFLAIADFFKNINTFRPDLDFSLNPQYEIKWGKRSFFADLYLNIVNYDKEVQSDFIIECDGHDFHEKTKEQVRNDRWRERCLQKEGYTVIRFSGSEIFEDPDECAREVWEIAKKIISFQRKGV